MFYIFEGIDNGDIIAQENIKIEQNDYVKDILFKINQSTYNLLKTYFPLLLNGKAPRIKQDKTKASYRRLRTDQESFVNWNLSTKAIYNLVRAVSFPYPKAWTLYKGDKIKINHGSIIDFNFKGFYFFEKPGTIIGNIKGFGCLIKTRDGIIAIDDLEPKDISLLIGDILGK